mmetsp:Transcript_55581/g.110451  ORF Transcript_55581/g.110451 Transcript_55581/m.110451 type:complete len:208 (+) Transcript_55581:477-1100(+)
MALPARDTSITDAFVPSAFASLAAPSLPIPQCSRFRPRSVWLFSMVSATLTAPESPSFTSARSRHALPSSAPLMALPTLWWSRKSWISSSMVARPLATAVMLSRVSVLLPLNAFEKCFIPSLVMQFSNNHNSLRPLFTSRAFASCKAPTSPILLLSRRSSCSLELTLSICAICAAPASPIQFSPNDSSCSAEPVFFSRDQAIREAAE